ncbi:MAG TPA: hypothetical protein VJT78_02950 [Candidatus Dormibacteraeota bacterium]|nr:hypothetical protein [Candidatus Dormibacteraeota bacterium]
MTFVLQLVILVLVIVLGIAGRRLRGYQRQILANERRILDDLRQLRELGQLDRETLANLAEQDRTITHHVNEGMRRLERELHRHMASNLLHAGGPPPDVS